MSCSVDGQLFNFLAIQSIVVLPVNNLFACSWSQLAVTTNDSYADEVQAYAAGAVEGYLTYGLIHNHYVNTVGSYCSQSSPFCSRLNDYLDKQDDWIRTNMRTNNSDYWHQVLLVMSQLQGIEWGYNKVTGENESYHINFRGFMYANNTTINLNICVCVCVCIDS
jgi:hypothetical protein